MLLKSNISNNILASIYIKYSICLYDLILFRCFVHFALYKNVNKPITKISKPIIGILESIFAKSSIYRKVLPIILVPISIINVDVENKSNVLAQLLISNFVIL